MDRRKFMNHFAHPEMLWLLALPFMFRWLMPKTGKNQDAALRIPFLRDIEIISAENAKNNSFNFKKNAFFTPAFFFLLLVWGLLSVAAARPQHIGEAQKLPGLSRDILLVADISNSMLEPDFTYQGRRIDRLTAVKKTASDFIKKRADDRIGLILFGTRAYLQSPITFDKKSVEEILWNTDAGMAGNSTSIGDALGLALKTLRSVPDKENKVIILMTDGENNDGSISIAQVIRLAKEEKVKIYTIGVGSDVSSAMSIFGINIGRASGLDEQSLSEIAEATKGTYFRAKDTGALEQIYAEIDRLEAARSDEQYIRETTELFWLPLIGAVLLSGIFIRYLRRK